MRLGRFRIVLPLLLIPSSALGHEHNKEEYFAASHMSGSSLWGGHLSSEHVFASNKHLSWVLDASAHGQGSRTDITGLTGIRLAGGWGGYIEPSVQLLAGYQRTSVSDASGLGSGGIAIAGGVGFVAMLEKPTRCTATGFKAQFDAIYRSTDSKDWHLRASFGFVVRYYPIKP